MWAGRERQEVSVTLKDPTREILNPEQKFLFNINYSPSIFFYFHFLVAEMVKRTACNAGDPVLIPRWGRSPGGGHDNPLQYSCLENPHGQRSLTGYSSWGHKEPVGTIEWLMLSLSFMAPQFSSIFTPYVSISKKYCVLSLYFLFILNSINWNAHNRLCVLYNGVLILISCFFFFPPHKTTMKDFLVLAKIILWIVVCLMMPSFLLYQF